MMIEVEIVGGPDDGKRIAVHEGVPRLRMAYAMNPARRLGESPLASRDPDYRCVEMPIKLTDTGYRAYWREP
jgi:hypothetical protein